jgi:signal transduction histidine kinase
MKDAHGVRELGVRTQRVNADEVLVTVTDTGIGLPPQQDQIFKPFFTTKRDGIGMGLAISRSIVESHGGRLWASNGSPGGASFYLTLPISVTQREASPV